MRAAVALLSLGAAACLAKPEFEGTRVDAAPGGDALDAPLGVDAPITFSGCPAGATMIDAFGPPAAPVCGGWATPFATGMGIPTYDRSQDRLSISVPGGLDAGCASTSPMDVRAGVVLELRGASGTPPNGGVYLEIEGSSVPVRLGLYAYTPQSAGIDYVVLDGGTSPAVELDLQGATARWLALKPTLAGGMLMIEGRYSTDGMSWQLVGAQLAELAGTHVVRIGATAQPGASASLQADSLYLCAPP